MTTGIFDPKAQAPKLTADDIDRLFSVYRALSAPSFGIPEAEVERLGPALRAQHYDWAALAAAEPAERIVELIKVLVLGEARFASWEAGAESPVIPLARALKSRGDYPKELTSWIRSNSRNRFLPHGSLLDRL